MSDREAFEKWAEGKLFLAWNKGRYSAYDTQRAWEAWQAARAEYGTTDSSKWRVDDLVQDINGDIFTIEGFKGDKLLVKDASENLWLTPTEELTWHSRPAENQNSET